MARKRTGNSFSYAEAKKMKLLTLHTHGCPRVSLRDCSSSSVVGQGCVVLNLYITAIGNVNFFLLCLITNISSESLLTSQQNTSITTESQTSLSISGLIYTMMKI